MQQQIAKEKEQTNDNMQATVESGANITDLLQEISIPDKYFNANIISMVKFHMWQPTAQK